MIGGDLMLFETFISIFNQVYVWLLNFLPRSPFQSFINAVNEIPYLSYLNWFFPISECIAVMQGFLAVVAVYYMYQGVMRFIHLIG